jgi:hypothetical protein
MGAAEPCEEMKELAFALSWRFQYSFTKWSFSELLLMVRRVQFPSWTWLGWEECPRNYDFHLFNSELRSKVWGPALKNYYLESAEVQYADGTTMQWGADWRRICVESETKEIDALRLDGWTFLFDLKKSHEFPKYMKARIHEEFGNRKYTVLLAYF